MFKNILIPTDGSPLSQKAAAQGVALAKAVGAKVTAFFAAPPATPIVYRDSLPVGYATPAEHAADDREDRRQVSRLHRARRQEGAASRARASTSPATIPADAILKIAAEEEVRPDRDGDARPGRPARRVHRQRDAEGAQPVEGSGAGVAIDARAAWPLACQIRNQRVLVSALRNCSPAPRSANLQQT